MKKIVLFPLLLLLYAYSTGNLASTAAAVPEAWLEQWNEPSAEMRPLQIVHGFLARRRTPEEMAYFKDECGLGGIVCNVGSKDYLQNEEEWAIFVDAVSSARKSGLRVWIYDEDGYPSPEAGGLVLKGHPELESLALTYDPTAKEPFVVRAAYEHTHASNNFAAARRYPNPLNPDSTKRFIEVTHEQYRKRLGDELFGQIEAFFTDEPSMNAVNIGALPENVRSGVRVDDPIDTTIKPLPMVPWFDDVPERYETKYGESLIPLQKSLFEGDSEKDKTVRARFWTLLGELDRERYYGAIQDWCQTAGSSVPTLEDSGIPLILASSGHTLHEEPTVAHVPLDGNKLRVLTRMDVPGLDMLNSDPRSVFWGAWRAAAFPCSAAELTGKRLVMSEVSDFSQQMEGKGEVGLDSMCATAAWQASWGVTEFTLYYGIEGRGTAVHKKYCDFVGRLNSILREAVPVRKVLLYYPVKELQEEYMPQAEPISLEKQSPKTRDVIEKFERLGAELVKSQIPFVLTDQPEIDNRDNKRILIRDDLSPLETTAFPALTPATPWVALGRFSRGDRDIFLLVNTDEKPYSGILTLPENEKKRTWTAMNPLNGEIASPAEEIKLELAPGQTMLYIGE